jgi:endonuclease/exonuclease/phosphatase family metal-dependent hydrolase
LLLTRFPIVESNSTVYKNFSKPADYGLRADGYAAKGVIHARVAYGNDSGMQLDVFVTHLEARADDLRPLQYGE